MDDNPLDADSGRFLAAWFNPGLFNVFARGRVDVITAEAGLELLENTKKK
jgi:hypothetical protein